MPSPRTNRHSGTTPTRSRPSRPSQLSAARRKNSRRRQNTLGGLLGSHPKAARSGELSVRSFPAAFSTTRAQTSICRPLLPHDRRPQEGVQLVPAGSLLHAESARASSGLVLCCRCILVNRSRSRALSAPALPFVLAVEIRPLCFRSNASSAHLRSTASVMQNRSRSSGTASASSTTATAVSSMQKKRSRA